ncbi:MAG: DNA mismatch repair protein MutL, partial [SAR202 cluster bacterium]|nr:DNA mismatch repair protein MutL [SAR202 cluster bacterium]
GWLLEAFGGQTILVRAMPSLLASRGVARSLMDLLDAASAETALPTWEHRIGATMACHGSVRAGQTLSVAEMTELLSSLQACHEPQTCPHGRPTMLHLSSTHLERQFRRR